MGRSQFQWVTYSIRIHICLFWLHLHFSNIFVTLKNVNWVLTLLFSVPISCKLCRCLTLYSFLLFLLLLLLLHMGPGNISSVLLYPFICTSVTFDASSLWSLCLLPIIVCVLVTRVDRRSCDHLVVPCPAQSSPGSTHTLHLFIPWSGGILDSDWLQSVH